MLPRCYGSRANTSRSGSCSTGCSRPTGSTTTRICEPGPTFSNPDRPVWTIAPPRPASSPFWPTGSTPRDCIRSTGPRSTSYVPCSHARIRRRCSYGAALSASTESRVARCCKPARWSGSVGTRSATEKRSPARRSYAKPMRSSTASALTSIASGRRSTSCWGRSRSLHGRLDEAQRQFERTARDWRAVRDRVPPGPGRTHVPLDGYRELAVVHLERGDHEAAFDAYATGFGRTTAEFYALSRMSDHAPGYAKTASTLRQSLSKLLLRHQPQSDWSVRDWSRNFECLKVWAQLKELQRRYLVEFASEAASWRTLSGQLRDDAIVLSPIHWVVSHHWSGMDQRFYATKWTCTVRSGERLHCDRLWEADSRSEWQHQRQQDSFVSVAVKRAAIWPHPVETDEELTRQGRATYERVLAPFQKQLNGVTRVYSTGSPGHPGTDHHTRGALCFRGLRHLLPAISDGVATAEEAAFHGRLSVDRRRRAIARCRRCAPRLVTARCESGNRSTAGYVSRIERHRRASRISRAHSARRCTSGYPAPDWPCDTETPRTLRNAGASEPGMVAKQYLSTGDLALLWAQPTRIVVLSSCNSGVAGVTTSRQEYLGPAAAAWHAGPESMVGSHVPVDDAVAAMLMGSFYARLSAGDHPATALQAAERRVREPLDR